MRPWRYCSLWDFAIRHYEEKTGLLLPLEDQKTIALNMRF